MRPGRGQAPPVGSAGHQPGTLTAYALAQSLPTEHVVVSTPRFCPTYAPKPNAYNLADRHYVDEIHPLRAVPGGLSASLFLEMKL